MSHGLVAFYLITSIRCHVSGVVTMMLLWILRSTSMRGEASLNPAREMTFSFISVRDVYRKPPVSYLHLYVIVSKAFLVKILFALFH